MEKCHRKIFLSHTARDLELFYDADALAQLAGIGTVVVNPLGHLPDSNELLKVAGDADVIITEWNTGADREFFEKTSRLLAFVRCGVEILNVDIDAATSKGVLVVNTPNRYTIPVAELTIGFMICLARNTILFHNETRAGNIGTSYNLLVRDKELDLSAGFELHGETLGIVGFGSIGRSVAKLAHAFGMTILAYDPFVSRHPDYVHLVELDVLLQRSRFVSINCKLTDKTRNLIDEKRINEMRSDAFLINTARGPLVDEKALVRALQNGKLAGAAVDVFATEPEIKGNPLLSLPNVIVTPHIGGHTPGTRYRQAQATVDIVRAILAGQVPDEVVNPTAIGRFKQRWK